MTVWILLLYLVQKDSVYMDINSYLSILIQIWVESYSVVSSGLKADQHGTLGKLYRKQNTEHKAPIRVRGP